MKRICLALAVAAGHLAGEPAAEAAQVVDHINRHRDDRRLGTFHLAQWVRAGAVPGLQHRLVVKRMHGTRLPPGPGTLVWNVQLAAAAVQLLVDPIPAGKPVDASARAVTAGYSGAVAAEVGSASGPVEHAWAALAMRQVGTDSKQRDKILLGLPPLLEKRWREVGVAIRRDRQSTNLAVVVGEGPAGRLAGGIVWRDADRDGRPDANEVVDGFRVAGPGDASATSSGGLWRLEFPKTVAGALQLGAGKDAGTAALAADGDTFVRWRAPIVADQAAADAAIAKADAIIAASGTDQARSELVVLAMGARTWQLDPMRAARITVLTEPVAGRLQQDLDDCLAALGEERQEFRTRSAKVAQTWGSGLRAWLRELEQLQGLRARLGRVLQAPESERDKLTEALSKQLDAALQRSQDPACIAQLELWRGMLLE